MKSVNELFKDDRIFSTAELREKGVSQYYLKKWLHQDKIEKISYGLYVKRGSWVDQYAEAQYNFPKGVISHRTALYLYDYTNAIPQKIHMTFPQGYHSRSPEFRKLIVPYFISAESHDQDVEGMRLGVPHTIHVYSRERTIVDVWRSNEDISIKIESLNAYMDDFENRSIGKLTSAMGKYKSPTKLDEALGYYLINDTNTIKRLGSQ